MIYGGRRPEADWYRGVWGAEPPRECASGHCSRIQCSFPARHLPIYNTWMLIAPLLTGGLSIDTSSLGGHAGMGNSSFIILNIPNISSNCGV